MAAENKVFHGDLYRIENFHDFETLGLEDVFAKPAIVILEWSENFPLKTPWPQIRSAPAAPGRRRRAKLPRSNLFDCLGRLTFWLPLYPGLLARRKGAC